MAAVQTHGMKNLRGWGKKKNVEHSLISNPNAWDAMQTVNAAQTQIWDEIVAASCDLDSRREVIPDAVTCLVFSNPGYRLLSRIGERIRESWRCGDMENFG